jgi:drug/metabolite transporter (DMT)-like permease
MLGPVVTIILAVFILSEPFGIYQFLGVSLVALGVGLLTLSPVTHGCKPFPAYGVNEGRKGYKPFPT